MRCLSLLAVTGLAVGCAAPTRPVREPPRITASAEPPRAPPSGTPTPPTSPPPSPPTPPDPNLCGALGCRLYDTPTAAFTAVLAQRPLVLALGEAHAKKDTPGVASSAKRFTTEMLPALKDKASDLVIELMAPPTGCEAKTKTEVRRKVETITEKQADTNQDEYLAMGTEAKKLGIEPHILRPTCADFKALNAPGANTADVALQLIGRLMREETERLLARNESTGIDKVIVLYGGAIHNDVEPMEAAAPYGYGPALTATTKGRYVELDVFVPELIRDAGLWLSFAWYPHFDKSAHPEKATLFTLTAAPPGASSGPTSFTMLLPASQELQRKAPRGAAGER